MSKRPRLVMPRRISGPLKAKWHSNLQFPNINGKIVTQFLDEKDAVNLFLEVAKVDLHSIIQFHRVRIEKIGEHDNIPDEEARKIVKDAEQRLAYYKLFSPHTYCFTPYSSDYYPGYLYEAQLRELMKPLLKLENYHKQDIGPWLRYVHPESEMPLTLFNRKDRFGRRHSTHLCAYLSTEKEQLRMKLRSTHKGNSNNITDKLDVEAQFHRRRFEGIAHFHVEKEFTSEIIYNHLDGRDYENFLGEPELIYQRHPLKFVMTVHLDTGVVAIKQPIPSMVTMDDLNRKYKIITEWQKHPELVGGELFYAIVEYVRRNRSFATLQHRAVKQYKH